MIILNIFVEVEPEKASTRYIELLIRLATQFKLFNFGVTTLPGNTALNLQMNAMALKAWREANDSPDPLTRQHFLHCL